jgi:multidrug efflux system membrane fusion protein
VKPGPSTPEQVAVEGDLAAGTRVVIDGADRLRPGMRVEVADRSGQGKGGQRRRDGAKKGDAPAGGAPAAEVPAGAAPGSTATTAPAAGPGAAPGATK